MQSHLLRSGSPVGQGVSMLQEAKTAKATRGLAVRLHRLVTEKSLKDVLSVVFLITGTIVWGFGDLQFVQADAASRRGLT